jgi:hypothetical protein
MSQEGLFYWSFSRFEQCLNAPVSGLTPSHRFAVGGSLLSRRSPLPLLPGGRALRSCGPHTMMGPRASLAASTTSGTAKSRPRAAGSWLPAGSATTRTAIIPWTGEIVADCVSLYLTVGCGHCSGAEVESEGRMLRAVCKLPGLPR